MSRGWYVHGLRVGIPWAVAIVVAVEAANALVKWL